MFRVIFAIYRLPELTHEQFAERYRQHGPLPRAFPGAIRYTQCLVSRSKNLFGPEADAISILDFESEDAYRRADASAEMQAAHDDAASFVGHVAAYYTEPREVP
jgi:uncharacterized protein (TIGR02118 family)